MKIAVLMTLMVCCATDLAVAAVPAPPGGPALDLEIAYYSRVLTPEGVTREARYEETMIRRPGHVWVARRLPEGAPERHDDEGRGKNASHGGPGHAEFNYVVLPRHVTLEDNKLKVEYIDTRGKAVVAIPASEYDNVNFDGSWANAFFLLDPKLLKAIPPSAKQSPVAGAQWREREKNGVFERVLWDEKKQIPLLMESGDRASTYYRRVEVKARATQVTTLPWQKLSGYSQKEFSDYLD